MIGIKLWNRWTCPQAARSFFKDVQDIFSEDSGIGNLGKLNHIAIATPNLEASVNFYK